MQAIDIHSHLQFSDFDNDRDSIIAELNSRDWGTFVVGTNTATSRGAVNLASRHDNIWATIGHHPTVLDKVEISTLEAMLLDEIARENIVAIGECGLDYFRSPKDQVYDQQVENFQAQIDLSVKHQLPLVLHGRPAKASMEAYQDMIDILKERVDELPHDPGNAHFFVGDQHIAKQFLEMNFTVSFDGPITFARDYDEVIQYVPVDMIHAETDAPYAAPVPHRGQQNSPLFVDQIVKALIEIRGEVDPESFKNQLVENAKRIFVL